ncbi:GDSL esterase/lipase-like protein [Salvia divinorum]|uniref:GDSL esterase/lipase-like protein n=1 Tax=Salvia divinorum TaxID=28513 RepID=A0ABD1HV70_SALDI
MFSQTLGDAKPQFPGFFIFGDSFVDNGNNNDLQTTLKVNYLPYGIDFQTGPTGRFSNGRNIADFIAKTLGFKNPIPPFANGTTQYIIGGINYGSGGAGLLNETGSQFGDLLSHTPKEFAALLIDQYSKQLRRLYENGARKVAVSELGELGCMPVVIEAYGSANSSSCVETSNDVVQIFNQDLKLLINNLNRHYPKAKFVYTRFTALSATSGSAPCSNRDEYRFWDEVHPTEEAAAAAANIAYDDIFSLVC